MACLILLISPRSSEVFCNQGVPCPPRLWVITEDLVVLTCASKLLTCIPFMCLQKIRKYALDASRYTSWLLFIFFCCSCPTLCNPSMAAHRASLSFTVSWDLHRLRIQFSLSHHPALIPVSLTGTKIRRHSRPWYKRVQYSWPCVSMVTWRSSNHGWGWLNHGREIHRCQGPTVYRNSLTLEYKEHRSYETAKYSIKFTLDF